MRWRPIMMVPLNVFRTSHAVIPNPEAPLPLRAIGWVLVRLMGAGPGTWDEETRQRVELFRIGLKADDPGHD